MLEEGKVSDVNYIEGIPTRARSIADTRWFEKSSFQRLRGGGRHLDNVSLSQYDRMIIKLCTGDKHA